MYIKKDSDNIRIDGYKGTWHVIDKMNLYDFNRSFAVTLYLLDSEQHSDVWSRLIVTQFGDVVCGHAYNGFKDLEVYEAF